MSGPARDGERLHVVLLAGDRGAQDPVARAAGSSCKALAELAGRPMVLRVVEALRRSQSVASIQLVGPAADCLPGCPELAGLVRSGQLSWMEPAASPAASAFLGLSLLPPEARVLLTTADHALLRPEVIDHFCAQALAAAAAGRDAVAAVAQHEDVLRAFPGMRRTALRLRGEAVCGCNLFAFLTPASRELAQFWRRVEAERKRPWKMIALLGWRAVLAFGLGRLTLDAALAHLSAQTGLSLGVVRLPFPEAAVDVDSAQDLMQVRALLEQRASSGAS